MRMLVGLNKVGGRDNNLPGIGGGGIRDILSSDNISPILETV